MSTTAYIHLFQGAGGIYTMPSVFKDADNDDQKVQWIGTHGCFTCVCVYIPLDHNQCFAAHIDSHTGPHNRTRDWIPETPAEAELLKAYVHERLAAALPSLANGEYATNPLRSKAIIVCPRRELYLSGTYKMPASGWPVIEAIREFFRFSPGSHGTHFAHGFVVNHSTGDRHMLKWESDEVNEELLDRWDQIRRKEEDEKVERDNEEFEQHSDRLKKKLPEELGFGEVDVPQEDWLWTLQYDRILKEWKTADVGSSGN